MGAQMLALGFHDFAQLAAHVRALPCDPQAWPVDPLAVLRKGRGTASDKHRLLASVAQQCGHPEVVLTAGIYEMNVLNTPAIEGLLAAAGVSFIPESHSYLMVDHHRFDFSGRPPALAFNASPFAVIIEEHFVMPDELSERERQAHLRALSRWAERHGLAPEAAWALHQACRAAGQDLPA